MASLALAGCGRAPDEQALREAIATMAASAEARDAAAVAKGLSAEFIGPGGVDREQFRQRLALVWLRQAKVGVTLGPLDVELKGASARVRFTAALSGGEGWLPDQAQVYRVDSDWRIEDGEWRVLSARWEPAL